MLLFFYSDMDLFFDSATVNPLLKTNGRRFNFVISYFGEL